MAASSHRTITLTLIAAIVVWVWALGAALFALRWVSIVRPLPSARILFPYGEMRVGVDASYPPFAVDTGNGLFGLDIDLANALGQRLNVSVRFVTLGYDGLYDALRTDQVDVLISALLIEPMRRGDVHYSQPYFDAGLVLVSNAESPVTDMRSLPGLRLALEFGSDAQTEANRWLRRIVPFELLPYELTPYALDSARLGDADAALADRISTLLYLREHPEWNPQITPVTSTPFAIATRLDRGDRAAALSAALQQLIDEGTLQRIIDRYL